MKVSELKGKLLDCWVAKAEGWRAYKEKRGDYTLCVVQRAGDREPWRSYRNHEEMKAEYSEVSLIEAVKIGFYGVGVEPFSTNWCHGGPIIERERMSFGHMGGGKYEALIYASRVCAGDTMLIAAMRCYVNYKFGDEVPDE